MPVDKLPLRPVAATCPSCGSRFMFRPATPETGASKARGGAGQPRYRDDFDIIKAELVSGYADMLGRQKRNVTFIAVLLALYGLMYFIVTAIYYLYLKSNGRPVAEFSEYLLVACSYVAFFPAMVMHSWKFIDAGSQHLVDRVFGYKGTFFVVMISYAFLLAIHSHLFGGSQAPLGLLFPVIVSALIPSLLHVLTDSL